jgi:hypothetical protein
MQILNPACPCNVGNNMLNEAERVTGLQVFNGGRTFHLNKLEK